MNLIVGLINLNFLTFFSLSLLLHDFITSTNLIIKDIEIRESNFSIRNLTSY